MKNFKHYIWVSFILIFTSFFMFLIHYLVFGQLENTIYYSLMSLCFIPINILGVTLVFEKLEDRRAKIERLNKLNMLVGLFFSDVGFNLLKLIASGDTKINLLNLDFNDIRGCTSKLAAHDHDISFELIDYPKLKQLVIGSREILSTLIANENILEHEIFTDLLMALMHLRDEILFIQHKEELDHDDSIHLKGDLVRVYKTLTVQWINYLSHLKEFYPFQYNSAIKFNPFSIRS